jgi:hypothetical protein
LKQKQKFNHLKKITMKNTFKLFTAILLGSLAVMTSCSDDDMPAATTYYQQNDQMARPGIATVFVSSADKNLFNTTTPSTMGAAFGAKFQTQLMALNPAYSTNLLGLTATQFSGVLATDVLTASTTGVTTFYDGTNVLTGRALADDVIDVELILIFGGPTGASNPTLTSDNVDENDKAFLPAFPYLAAPF